PIFARKSFLGKGPSVQLNPARSFSLRSQMVVWEKWVASYLLHCDGFSLKLVPFVRPTGARNATWVLRFIAPVQVSMAGERVSTVPDFRLCARPRRNADAQQRPHAGLTL